MIYFFPNSSVNEKYRNIKFFYIRKIPKKQEKRIILQIFLLMQIKDKYYLHVYEYINVHKYFCSRCVNRKYLLNCFGISCDVIGM